MGFPSCVRATVTAGARWGLPTLRVASGLLFVWAGVVKAMDPRSFAAAIDGYRLLPHALGGFTALYLPWLEIICGTCLIVRRQQAPALLVLLSLMALFIAALAAAWLRGLDVACGCFGGTGRSDYWSLLLRDLAITTALAILALSVRRVTPPSPAGTPCGGRPSGL